MLIWNQPDSACPAQAASLDEAGGGGTGVDKGQAFAFEVLAEKLWLRARSVTSPFSFACLA
jgi:hypothetical protein